MPVPASYFVDRAEAYTPRDVTMAPWLWLHGSRRLIDLAPPDFAGSHHPVVASNMNSLAGMRMAVRIAQCGGLAVLTQDMSLPEIARILREIKAAHPRFARPLIVSPRTTITEASTIINKMGHHLIVVVGKGKKPVGVVTKSDLKEFKGDPARFVTTIMHREVESVTDNMSYEEIFGRLYAQRIHAAPVVDSEGKVVGVVTRRDCVIFGESKSGLPPIIRGPSIGEDGRLMVGIAVGINGTALERAQFGIQHGANFIVIDTAHGYQQRMIATIKKLRAELGSSVPIVAGNVCEAEGARALFNAGADVVKVGVGPGAVCITREETGHGVPQFTAVCECAQVARELGKHIWADGGISAPGEAIRLLAAGASRVMVGTALVGTFESRAEIEEINGALYKRQSGMAGATSVESRNQESGDRYEAEMRGLYVEGASGVPVPITEKTPDVLAFMARYATGFQSGCSYSGSLTLSELWANARFRVQTAAGDREGKPHAIKA